jgi:sensor histidine kinase YesM
MDQIKQREDLRILYNKELAQVEMKALRAQINPHFLFNSLNSINNYILKNDTKQASRYLVKFSQLVRNILNNSSNPFISLQEELQTIELYMLIEGMRFNNQFKYSIDILDEINSANIMIPSLLLQPYVENAIWHGLLHKEGEKHIRIKVSKQSETSVSITIEDNGVGRKMSELIEQKPKHRKSFGMELGASRLRLMNQNNDQQASVDVIDLVNKDNSPLGTQIKIIIPATLFSDTSS